MERHHFDISQQKACEAIEKGEFDFTATYLAAFDLNRIVQQDVGAIQPDVIKALEKLLLSRAFDGQRQRRFLFREAATVLATIVQLGRSRAIARQAYEALQTVFKIGRDHALQAAADALGSLPLDICGPNIPSLHSEPAMPIRWTRLLNTIGACPESGIQVKGRSLLIPTDNGRIAVIKMARKKGEIPGLRREIQWIYYLSGLPRSDQCRFHIPRLLTMDGATLIQLKRVPNGLASTVKIASDPAAVVYIASAEYFQYPNPRTPGELPTADAFVEMMGRNAELFASFARKGILHEAPIPLFHNRLQQERRRDGGMYEWFRAGRLDRWLDSCDFPNFGQSGLRDFEHFCSFHGKPIELYRSMGHQLLSLLLVAGSYFRARDPNRVGWDCSGRPVDARDLFDKILFRKVVDTIYERYHAGFVGGHPDRLPPVDLHHLVDRMIDEMGVDRYMQESLRVADQATMSKEAFGAFLAERGCDGAGRIEQGAKDLELMTGPHLGAFNRQISIPEMIEAAAAMAATCVAERFLKDNRTFCSTSGR